MEKETKAVAKREYRVRKREKDRGKRDGKIGRDRKRDEKEGVRE